MNEPIVAVNRDCVLVIVEIVGQFIGAVSMVASRGDADKAKEISKIYRGPKDFIDGNCSERDLAKFIRATAAEAIATLDASELLK